MEEETKKDSKNRRNMNSEVKLKCSKHLAVVLVVERIPLKMKTHTKFEIYVCTHARRMNTERDNVVIHMLSCGAGGSASVCSATCVRLCQPFTTGCNALCVCLCMCVCVCVCGFMHFLFSDTNMAGTGTEN